ncbi:hypothetical protein D4Q52_15630 [Rhodopseudomonas palustris]|uniref:Outer membrane protein beta-barrel domain-containing protein n=2 Tax=Rhodopseudomonas palustris TaxID=1076 RepID=A0A418V3Y9_RHOPL|nr:hypothetical protein D4Q52_15630 [Rhodopseudomonas palustris]
MMDNRMFRPVIRISLAAALLSLGAQAASAQSAPIRYWVPGGPFGFGGGATESWQPLSWGDVPGFTASEPDEDGFRTGFVARAYSTPVSAFSSGLNWRGVGGIGGAGAFGNFGSLAVEGSQYGYNFKGVGNTPMTLFGGVDQLKYQPDVFTSLTSPGFSSGNTAATAVHAGVEIRPTSNLSLSFSAGYVQPNGAVDSDIRSNLLPGESPMFSGGRR